MSAFNHQRRSRSKTAPETAPDIAQTNGTIPTSASHRPDPSSTLSPSRPPMTTALSTLDPESDTVSAAAMLSTLPTSNILSSDPALTDRMDTTHDGIDDHPDNRSSSLSELGDASDEHSEATPRPLTAADSIDNDSEAETERLEKTPRKLTRTATITSITSENLYERTPSKLVHSTTVDENASLPTSPTQNLLKSDASAGNTALDTLSFLAASEAVSLELAGKKRKRPSAENSSVDEPIGQPPRKRSSTIRDTALNGGAEDVADESEPLDAEEELDNAEEAASALVEEEAEVDADQVEMATEPVDELATVVKVTKRKGGRRGKRKIDDTGGTIEAVSSTEALSGEGDGDNDEEDSAAHDELAAKKKNAIEELAKIERKFKIFREKLCDEQIAQCEQELEMLRQPNCVHPEYLAMVQSIDERRAGKIAYERALRRFKEESLERTAVAERYQLHQQYMQTAREIRDKSLAECNQRMYELQRGRRQLGIEEVEYAPRLPEKRSERIRQQTAYNLEVSILSGVAKYVGFPAAPEIRPAKPSEIEDDLRAMHIVTRPPVAPIPYVRPYGRNSTADEVAAEEQFIEKTPWANPQHPAHQQTHFAVAIGSRPPNQPYQTPAGQRRLVDIQQPNGSASTIDAISNPPSSTGGPGHYSNGRMGESISPVLQMKRHPSDQLQYAESPVPGSLPRHITGMARDYPGPGHMLSSPSGPEDQGPRWAGMNANGAPPLPPGAGRPVPLTQRSSLGTVSVGSGSLFGR